MTTYEITVSGAEFKRIYPGKKFYKLTNLSENHNGLQFKDGLIEDIIPFNPIGECTPGGIYFTDEEHIPIWIAYNDIVMHWIREIRICNDAKVCILLNKHKIDKIVLLRRKEIWSDVLLCKKIVMYDGNALQYVKEQTEEICKLAVQQNGCALWFVKEKTEDICKLVLPGQNIKMEDVNRLFNKMDER